MCNGSQVCSVGANKRVLYFRRTQKQRLDNTAFRNLEFFKFCLHLYKYITRPHGINAECSFY
jgi:hypothetical protein